MLKERLLRNALMKKNSTFFLLSHSLSLTRSRLRLLVISCFINASVVLLVVLVISAYLDSRITNFSFDHFTGTIYLVDSRKIRENHRQKSSMITSTGMNPVDHQYISNHHVSLITQPVLAGRSRSKKNRIQQITSMDKDHSGHFSNDSPQFILPVQRVDPKKSSTISPSHQESSDSGVDLSLSTNSSVQYPSTHLIVHRPLSALNEDSSPDEGYPDDQIIQPVRLRFPPVNLGRNRSMEDILTNHSKHFDEQHRSSSFTDERNEKLLRRNEQKLKRSSDGALLELYEATTSPSKDFSSRSHDQHRSINDFNQKNVHQVLSNRHESNLSTDINNLPSTQTFHRKPNTLTLKPLRKKPQLNPIHEPTSIPLNSSRLYHHDDQISLMTGTTNNSSNQTTPRSIRLLIPPQQTIKSKVSSMINSHPNDESSRQHRTNTLEKPPPPPPPPTTTTTTTLPLTIQPRRGVLQQMIPFDASPSKTNNLLVRHHLQPTSHFRSSMIPLHHNGQTTSTRSTKACLPFISTEDFGGNHQTDEQRKTKGSIKTEKFIKEQREKKRSQQQKDEIDQQKISMKTKGKESFDFIGTKRDKSSERLDVNDEEQIKQPIRHLHRQQQQQQRSKPSIINDREQSNESIHRSQQRKGILLNQHRPSEQPKLHRERPLYRPIEMENAIGSEMRVHRPTKLQLQTSETPTTVQHRNPYRPLNQWTDDQYPWRKTVQGSTTKINRIQPTSHNNVNAPSTSDRTKVSLKSETKEMNEKRFHQIIPKNQSTLSPTSLSIVSEQNQSTTFQMRPHPRLHVHLSESSTSPTSSEEFLDQTSTTPRTYRLIESHAQPIIQMKNVSTSPINDPPSLTSSRHTQPFVCSAREENFDRSSIDKIQTNTSGFDFYQLSDRENSSPSPILHVPITKKIQFSPHIEQDEQQNDSDDGWSESSADILYVDERYRIERQKLKSSSSASSHLTTSQKQTNYSNQIRQQNVLLQ